MDTLFPQPGSGAGFNASTYVNSMVMMMTGGGYILAPAHNVQADTSVENIQAMYEAVRS